MQLIVYGCCKLIILYHHAWVVGQPGIPFCVALISFRYCKSGSCRLAVHYHILRSPVNRVRIFVALCIIVSPIVASLVKGENNALPIEGVHNLLYWAILLCDKFLVNAQHFNFVLGSAG